MLDALLKLNHAPLTLKINYLLIPVTQFDISPEGAKQFNVIYKWLESRRGWSTIPRTKSGGIKIGKELMFPSWDIKKSRNCIELTILAEEGMWRIQFRVKTAEQKMSGHTAFVRLKRYLLAKGIDLDKYAIQNGAEVKATITPAPIGLARLMYVNHTFNDVHHIDFHSSYPAGLVNTHPEFKEVISEIYEKRHEDEVNKAILNYSIGFMQSIIGCGARWAHLSKDAIHDNNKRVLELGKKLEKTGRVVLMYNTDGIWYMGAIYHGDGEGDGLGQWTNDHTNCQWRAKSDGAYEYIENGEYHPIIRGVSNELKLDWEWGDIYKNKAIAPVFRFDEKEGVKCYG